MDNRAEVREFLTSRRAKITPDQARVPQAGRRRVPGLRRSEVADLAGMSVEYYAKLERGALGGVSASVLDAIARALQLDEAERAHLFHLAQAADGTSAAMRPRRRSNQWTVRPSLQWTLDTITTAPAIVGNNRSDLLATNHLGRALYADLYNDPNGAPNFARFTFLDSAAHRFYPDWDLAADMTVANLRTAAGQDPHNKSLHDLVGELSTRSDEFRRRWGSHNVRTHGTGTKHYHHHVVGDLTLAYESFDLRAEPGLSMTIYAAEPDSPTAHHLPCSPPSPPPNSPPRSRHGHKVRFVTRSIATNTTVELAELLDFARPRHRLLLATTRRDGRPQISPVSGGVDLQGRIVISTYPSRAKTRNAERDPRVSVLVLSDDWNGPWVQVDGDAEVLHMPEAADGLVDYFRCISGEHPDWEEYREAMRIQDKSLIRITPTRWGPIATGGFPADMAARLDG